MGRARHCKGTLGTQNRFECTVEVSFVELYMEKFKDLLTDEVHQRNSAPIYPSSAPAHVRLLRQHAGCPC